MAGIGMRGLRVMRGYFLPNVKKCQKKTKNVYGLETTPQTPQTPHHQTPPSVKRYSLSLPCEGIARRDYFLGCG